MRQSGTLLFNRNRMVNMLISQFFDVGREVAEEDYATEKRNIGSVMSSMNPK
jgi:hypothetical protein